MTRKTQHLAQRMLFTGCEHIHIHYVFMCGVYTSHVVSHSRAKRMRNSTCSFNELLFTSSKLLNFPLFRHSNQAIWSVPFLGSRQMALLYQVALPCLQNRRFVQHYPGLCEFPQHLYTNHLTILVEKVLGPYGFDLLLH